MKHLYFLVCSLTLATLAMAEEIDWQRLGAATTHRPSLPERLGDGPVFLFALICAGVGLFFVSAVVYAQFRKRYWPTATQKAHAAWLLATQTAAETASADRPADLKKTMRWSRQALAALMPEDRFAVEQILRTTKDAGRPKELLLYYKTHESLAWMYLYAPMMAIVLWVGYEQVWMGKTGTSLWWAYLVICGAFSLVLGVLPLSIFWTDVSARRKETPVWQVNAIGIGLGKNMDLWPQIEEIRLREVVRRKQAPQVPTEYVGLWPKVEEIRLREVARSKQAPLVLVELKRRSDTEHFPNIDPANVKLCFSDGAPASGGAPSILLKEIMLSEDANERAATLAAILRYRHHWAKAAFADEWQAYRAA